MHMKWFSETFVSFECFGENVGLLFGLKSASHSWVYILQNSKKSVLQTKIIYTDQIFIISYKSAILELLQQVIHVYVLLSQPNNNQNPNNKTCSWVLTN